MIIPPSKLAAARLAAAEVFIAEGLTGTNWEEQGADALRGLAERRGFLVGRSAGSVTVHVGVDDSFYDGIKVYIAPMYRSRLTMDQAADAAALFARSVSIARKVEAAIREVLAS